LALVSIMMPVGMQVSTLDRAVASVLAQTHRNWELLLIADGNLEPVSRILEQVDDSRIRLILRPESSGRGAARQAGLEAARGDFLAFLDADDWMYPERLTRQAVLMEENRDLALVCGGMIVEDDHDRIAGVRRDPVEPNRVHVFEPQLDDPPLLNAASMLRLDQVGNMGYDPRLDRGEDSDFFYRFLRNRAFLFHSDIVYCYREYDSFSMTGLREGMRESLDRRLRRCRSGIQRQAVLGRYMVSRLANEFLFVMRGRAGVLERRNRQASTGECEAHVRVREHLRSLS
jgi:glycosyltransferase involved in cell wall biosynthesis